MKNLFTEEVNLLRQNARSVVRELGLLNDAYFEIGVTLAERHLLIELTSCIQPTVGEIAERLLLDKSTASRLIAKAVKKGYIQCSSTDKDKRKRFIELTKLGKQTLKEFEPIAFNQTNEALLTLSPEEIGQVYQGVALYAKGLKNSRLKAQGSRPRDEQIESLAELRRRLKAQGFTLKLFSKEDEPELYAIFREVVDSGCQFPYESNSQEEFQRQFFAADSRVYVCHDSSTKKVIGGFTLRPNYSGRSSHVANAAYMLGSAYRGQGLGSLLVKASLQIAKECGFHAMQFNMVLSQNRIALQLYQKLGFARIGTIPQGVRNPDGSYQDAYILYRELTINPLCK